MMHVGLRSHIQQMMDVKSTSRMVPGQQVQTTLGPPAAWNVSGWAGAGGRGRCGTRGAEGSRTQGGGRPVHDAADSGSSSAPWATVCPAPEIHNGSVSTQQALWLVNCYCTIQWGEKQQQQNCWPKTKKLNWKYTRTSASGHSTDFCDFAQYFIW
jgi:hypothetical protein